MCGICGIAGGKGLDLELTVEQMMSDLKHRGPNDQGIFTENGMALGFVRLSIIDLSAAGHQPMLSNDQNHVLIFNGEIFNYLELREELKDRYEFRSGSDSEVILAAYRVWGEDCMHHFNGMFSFVIYDREKRVLFGARDRFGVKPFYYHRSAGLFAFASEIPPLLKLLPDSPLVNEQVMYDFLAFNRTDQNNETFFKSVFQLPHGHKLKFEKGELTISRWYDPRSYNKKPFETADEFREMLKDSVRIRLRSDVPVGICLSGGLDSSAITSICSKLLNRRDLETFSAVYGEGEEGDESEFIKIYDGEIKKQHFITPSAEQFLSDLKPFVKAHAEPMPSTSPYAQYKLMELASTKVVVTLDGQGSDEQLAGYHYFFGFYFKELFRSLRFFKLLREIYHYLHLHRSMYALKTFVYFLLPAGIKTRIDSEGAKCLKAEFKAKYSSSNRIVGSLYSSNNITEAGYDHFEHKLEHLLKWSDRNSMHFSVESRAPFLDYRLVEGTLSARSSLKINQGITKHLLREALKGILPDAIRKRTDKVGFETPSNEWFRHPKVKEFARDLINSPTFRSRGYFDHEQVLRIFTLHQDRKGNYGKEIWKWINVELWCREFIDR